MFQRSKTYIGEYPIIHEHLDSSITSFINDRGIHMNTKMVGKKDITKD